MKAPKTLQEAIIHFSDMDNCLAFMVLHRWPDGVVACPRCGRKDVVFLANQKKWQCKSVHPKRQFSAKVGTIFEDSPLGLEKWLPAVWLNNRKSKSDADRFSMVLSQVMHRRLTYAEVTGKVGETAF